MYNQVVVMSWIYLIQFVYPFQKKKIFPFPERKPIIATEKREPRAVLR